MRRMASCLLLGCTAIYFREVLSNRAPIFRPRPTVHPIEEETSLALAVASEKASEICAISSQAGRSKGLLGVSSAVNLRSLISRAISSVVERLLHTQEVAGSNPASRTICYHLDIVSAGISSNILQMRETRIRHHWGRELQLNLDLAPTYLF